MRRLFSSSIVSLIVTFIYLSSVSANANNSITLSIPSVGIQASITEFPLQGDSWRIDPWENQIGHLEGTAWAGSNIALGGHSRLPDGSAGVFAALDDVRAGDTITLNDGYGERQYQVVEVKTVPETDISIVYPTTSERLTLITCDVQSYNADAGYYSERVVVVAEPVN
jgi:LPXTG-site transpeptidase (sortase) family protein